MAVAACQNIIGSLGEEVDLLVRHLIELLVHLICSQAIGVQFGSDKFVFQGDLNLPYFLRSHFGA
jgi:hypothetical protein